MNAPPSRRLWIGVPGLDGVDAPANPIPGGVVLFGRNLDPDETVGPARCHALLSELQARWGGRFPLVVALDQEGGPVSRLRPWVGETPSLHRIWRDGGAAGCAAWGRLWGQGLALLGFNTDLAPVTDLLDADRGGAMGERCASSDPVQAALAAGAFLHGLEGAGIRGCLKHFPGLGGTRVDSHLELPERKEAEGMAPHLIPFRMLAHADRLVMVAHLKTPFSGGLPASLHPEHALRNPWGVAGRWVTDDLEMGAVSDWPWGERVRLAVEAGHEALLVCQTRAAVEAADEALQSLPGAGVFRTPSRPLLVRGTRESRFDAVAWALWVDEVRAAAAAL